VEFAQPPDAVGTLLVQRELPVGTANDSGYGQEGLERRADRNRARTGSTAAVGGRERLVCVDVEDVESNLGRFHCPENSVQVGAVTVHEPTGLMDRFCQL